MISSIAAQTSTTPTGSSSPPRPREEGSSRAAATSAATPMGRFSRKIGRQPQPFKFQEMSRPPSSGPAAAETPATAPYQPNALPRSRGGKAIWISARSTGSGGS